MSLVPFTSGNYSNNEVLIFEYLKQNGFNLAMICGILANIEKESNFNPNAVGDSGTSYGLCQWHNDRKNKLVNYCNKNGLSSNTVKGQISYLIYELRSSEKTAYDKIMSSSDSAQGAYDAGYNFCYYFERPSGKQSASVTRGNRALRYYEHYTNAPEGSIVISEDASLPSSGLVAGDYIIQNLFPLTDRHSDTIAHNLSNIEAEGYEYGYLIDLESNQSFRFYLPEFTEKAGANWGNVEIPGRSVDVKYYNSTTSRSVNIELYLYAGVGLYTPTSNDEDVVARLHNDLNFVKSLEYPDYSGAYITPPPKVLISLGKSLSFPGVVSDVVVDHYKPFDEKRRAMYAKLSFTVTQVETNPPSIGDIRKGNYTLAGISSDSVNLD